MAMLTTTPAAPAPAQPATVVKGTTTIATPTAKPATLMPAQATAAAAATPPATVTSKPAAATPTAAKVPAGLWWGLGLIAAGWLIGKFKWGLIAGAAVFGYFQYQAHKS